jgi:hypothetical protein
LYPQHFAKASVLHFWGDYFPVAPTTADEIFKTYINTTAMNFFDLHFEIRLKIYSELLVHLESIVFVADYGPPSPPLLRSE